jgi:hypothetical protein
MMDWINADPKQIKGMVTENNHLRKAIAEIQREYHNHRLENQYECRRDCFCHTIKQTLIWHVPREILLATPEDE